MDVAEVPALGTNLVALGSLGPSAPSATPNSASAAHLGPAWPILRHAAILRENSQRWHTQAHKLVLYLAHEHTRGLEGQPPVQYEHEVVTGDGDVDTLLQATP